MVPCSHFSEDTVLMQDNPEKVVHGGVIKQLRESTGLQVIDFSANLNPWPPAVPIEFSLKEASYYPDDQYFLLKESIAQVCNRPVDEIAVGNGSIELIRVFCLATLAPGQGIRIDTPTFGEYAFSARLAGAVEARAGERARVAFVCNPNNPTGEIQSRGRILSRLCGSDLLFVDEAFIELSDPRQSVADVRDPALFVCRSLTKSFAIPGLRFGYAFGDPDLIARIETIRPPWSVNTFAEQYAIKAFRSYDLLRESRVRIAAEREWLTAALRDFPVTIHPSSVNFLLLTFPGDVTRLCNDLLAEGVLVRDCHSFGLPDSIRIAVRTRDENRQLLEAMRRCVH